MKKLKNILIMFLFIPAMILCGCDDIKSNCNAVHSVEYYFEETIDCDIFNLPEREQYLSNLTNPKVNKQMLDSYAQLTFTAKPAEIYHLYIEYIYFKVYMNQDSEFDFQLNINMTNVINESDVGVSDVEDNEYTNMYSCKVKKNSSAVFKIYVNRVVATSTGSVLTIDILNSEIYATDEDTSFKWCIYDFKIYGESRAYSKV